MAVPKAIRSNSSAQPSRRRLNPQPENPRPPDPQLKSELFEALRHLNRGFGVALSSFDRLQRKDRLHHPPIFPRDFLLSYRNRTEALRSLANRDLLRLLAGREDQDAGRFDRVTGMPAKQKPKRRS
jgi:hypothetical protein